MRRRNFLVTPLAGFQPAAGSLEKSMYAFGDGITHNPEEYAQLLAGLAKSGKLTSDEYSRGGVVETLEARMASLLGKEAAVWLPTGTLANHLAVRLLAGDRRRVLVQEQSHLYNDCGDCAQTLSGVTLIPLAAGQATFRVEQVEEAANQAMMGRV